MKKILFVSYGGGHVNVLLPLFKRYLQEKEFECKYLALTTAASVLEKNRLPYISFKDIVDKRDILEIGKRLVSPDDNHTTVPYEESIAYMGASYSDLIADNGDEGASKIYELYGRQAFYPYRTLKKYLTNEKPDIVVSTNSPRAERAIIDAARELRIPSVCVVDLFALKEISWIGKSGFADKVCVISQYVKDRMVAAGRSPHEIIITGNPAFDDLYEANPDEKIKQFRSKKGWKDKEKIILWASGVEPSKHPFSNQCGDVRLPEKIESNLAKLVEENCNIRVVIRPHPNDRRKPRLSNGIELSTQDDDLNSLLRSVDCVVVMSSTVGMQAALLNKPLVNIKLSIFSCDAPYDDMGLSLGVSSLEKLNLTILKALGNKTSNGDLPTLGSATRQVKNIVDGCL